MLFASIREVYVCKKNGLEVYVCVYFVKNLRFYGFVYLGILVYSAPSADAARETTR